MNTVLLDTNIVSFLLKGDSRIEAYLPLLEEKQLAISFMTVAELYQWAFVRHWGKERIAQLEAKLQEDYLILQADVVTCQYWARVRADCQTIGKPISSQDAWVAAIALHYQLPLITHNVKDFIHIKQLNLFGK
jgi:tRNA(fMet)-specific endonuclease VapC